MNNNLREVRVDGFDGTEYQAVLTDGVGALDGVWKIEYNGLTHLVTMTFLHSLGSVFDMDGNPVVKSEYVNKQVFRNSELDRSLQRA